MGLIEGGASVLSLAIGAMTPAERAMGRYMRAPDHDGSGGEGGAAALLGGGEGGSGGDGGAGGAGTGGEGGGGEGGGDDPDWLGHFSAEGGDAENPSNRDWIKAKG